MNSNANSNEQASNDPESLPDSGTQKKPKRGGWLVRSLAPFRAAILRGLAIILPPLLTIVFFIWAWGIIESYVMSPVETILRQSVVWSIQDVRENENIQTLLREDPIAKLTREDDRRLVVTSEETFAQVSGGQWIPNSVVQLVDDSPGDPIPQSSGEYYHRYVQLRFLKRHLILPALLALFVVVLYVLGKLLAAGVGTIFWRAFESLVDRIPIIRNVYSSVKQVTDFAFNDDEKLEYTRVVAVEYPRKGIWSIGFVTGESFLTIREAAGEPILSVLMPTSPMPATGFAITVRKSETIDLDITIDQAIQFCVSCGVVVPENEQNKSTIDGEIRKRFQHIASEPNVNGSPSVVSGESPQPDSTAEG